MKNICLIEVTYMLIVSINVIITTQRALSPTAQSNEALTQPTLVLDFHQHKECGCQMM